MLFKLRLWCKALIISLFLSHIAYAEEPVNQDVSCMAKAIYFESRGGSELEMKDVGHVILNRLNSRKFSPSICGIVYQRTRSVCQFSWSCRPHKITEPKEYQKSVSYAEDLIVKEDTSSRVDNTNGALFFHTRNEFRSNRSRCHTNSQHVFFK